VATAAAQIKDATLARRVLGLSARRRPHHLSGARQAASILKSVPVRSRFALPALALATLAVDDGLAHHPGSHASRQADGRVRLDLVTIASDSCTTVASVERGAPTSAQAPKGSEPVTVRLKRSEGAVCATVVTATREEVVLDVPKDARMLHLFVVGPEGVRATERVPIR
jgi:hypothetical protein